MSAGTSPDFRSMPMYPSSDIDKAREHSHQRQWRICFEWPEGSAGPVDVEIVDYH
jgi:plasmid maintenance system killer protein